MNHLDQARLLALGTDAADQPTAHEEAHLDTCITCSTALTEERQLSQELAALPWATAPEHFLETTVVRFGEAYQRRATWRFVLLIGAALLLGLGLAVPVAALLVVNGPEILHQGAILVHKVIVVGRGLLIAGDKIPLLWAMVVAACGSTFMLSAAFTGRLALLTAEAK